MENYSLQVIVGCMGICMLAAVAAGAGSCPLTVGTKSFGKCSSFSDVESTLSWTYHPGNGSMDLAFKSKPVAANGWVGWGINPTTMGMVGTQAIIAFQQSNGSMATMTYNVTPPAIPQEPSAISYKATHLSSTYQAGTITIYATLVLPSNKTFVSHTWQVGSAVKGLRPQGHPLKSQNLKSFGSIDLVSGATAAAGPVGAPSSTITGSGSPSTPPSSPSSSKSSTTSTNINHLNLASLLLLVLSIVSFQFSSLYM